MFILTKIADLVQINSEDLNKPSRHAIEDNINAKYANKVIQKIGLCICLHDLLSASEGLIGHGTGIVNVNVEFRLVVFRPFKGEIILGKISTSLPTGINVRTDFFDEIFVPKENLPEDVFFDDTSDCFVWRNDDTNLYFDNHEPVRVQIVSEEWHDQIPMSGLRKADDVAEKPQAPYKLIGAMLEAGLGPILWW